MTSLAVLAILLWLPGALARRAFGLARGPWGAGRLAVEASLSLAVLSAALLLPWLAAAPVWTAPVSIAVAVLAIALVTGARRSARRVSAGDRASSAELLAFAAAVVLLLPTTLEHAGANVDDWWDLSFVAGWLADGRFGFSQMALSPDPATGASPVHPRFLWSVWLMLQASAGFLTGDPLWKLQAGPLAALVCVLGVSAQAALAHALLRGRVEAARVAAVTTVMAAAWIWGTEALPLFVRGYQDKLVAAFVLAPVLVAVFVDAVRAPSRAATLTAAAVAAATVSIHGLVFTMAAFACVLALAALEGRRSVAWLRAHYAAAAALVVPALYPLGQALWLAGTFSEQGVSLATRDNPVVRAHLSLNRLVGDVGPAWIVHPGAVFGGVALVAMLAFAVAWRRRRHDEAARVLVVLAAVPCVLMFVPGIAALAGRLWVPWMLYRVGWLVPVAALLGYAVVILAARARESGRVPVAAGALATAAIALALTTAIDRHRRGMDERPGEPSGAPEAAAAVVFDYLAQQPGRDPVLALANFSELVPALTGKPVVAFPERGTLVFAGDEARAYERLRDRASFFAASTPPQERDRVASRYGARWAVLPRRQVASASEAAWLWRFGPEVLVATRASDDRSASPCEPASDAPGRERCFNWWSATRESALEHLSSDWFVVLETRDYFVVEKSGSDPVSRKPASGEHPDVIQKNDRSVTHLVHSGSDPDFSGPRWLGAFDLTAPAPRPEFADVLASAVEAPGADVEFAIPPRFVLPVVMPVWTDGPRAWEDAPLDASITLAIDVPCRASALEVVPHLPRNKRDVLELHAGSRVVRAVARHNESILVPLDGDAERSRVTLDATSLLGNPVSLADVRLLGDPSTCGQGRPDARKARSPALDTKASALIDLAASSGGGRALVALSRSAGRSRSKLDAALLAWEAARRQPSLAEAWIELGFAEDELAAAAATPGEAEAAKRRALAAFRGAVRADSRSAWARGCLAWAEHRGGHALKAIAHSLAAASLDPLYADAWTILGYSLGGMQLDSLAERALAHAESIDPLRNWPALARADLASARGDADGARAALESWLAGHPYDAAAREKLAALAAPRVSPGGAAAAVR